jgi:uncharacterized membrane-anchored protein
VRRGLLVLGLLLCLGVPAALVVHKEGVLRDGRRVLLKLAPRDPRSLMQGDYMVLRYAVAGEVRGEEWGLDGRLVLTIDGDDVGALARRDDGRALAPGEVRLRYRIRKRGVRLGAESFFFQEGQAELYAQAEYGELRVAPSGEAVLVGLRDAERRPLGPR